MPFGTATNPADESVVAANETQEEPGSALNQAGSGVTVTVAPIELVCPASAEVPVLARVIVSAFAGWIAKNERKNIKKAKAVNVAVRVVVMSLSRIEGTL